MIYPVASYLARPDWSTVGRNLVSPVARIDGAYVTMLIGMVGTTIAPWMQFYLQSAVVEKNLQMEEYPLTRADVIFGCLVTDMVALSKMPSREELIGRVAGQAMGPASRVAAMVAAQGMLTRQKSRRQKPVRGV